MGINKRIKYIVKILLYKYKNDINNFLVKDLFQNITHEISHDFYFNR